MVIQQRQPLVEWHLELDGTPVLAVLLICQLESVLWVRLVGRWWAVLIVQLRKWLVEWHQVLPALVDFAP